METLSQTTWWAKLEAIHNESRAGLTRRAWHQAIQAASRNYTSQRQRLSQSVAPSPAIQLAQHGYYGVMHALIVQAIAAYFHIQQWPFQRLIDIGCNTGVAGLTLCAQLPTITSYIGLEPQRWAAKKAKQFQLACAIPGKIFSGTGLTWQPQKGDLILLSFVLNEMTESQRKVLHSKLLHHLEKGAGILIIEPIARHITPWWDSWLQSFLPWSYSQANLQKAWPVQTPQMWFESHHGAGFHHQRWKARSLWIYHPDYGQVPLT